MEGDCRITARTSVVISYSARVKFGSNMAFVAMAVAIVCHGWRETLTGTETQTALVGVCALGMIGGWLEDGSKIYDGRIEGFGTSIGDDGMGAVRRGNADAWIVLEVVVASSSLGFPNRNWTREGRMAGESRRKDGVRKERAA